MSPIVSAVAGRLQGSSNITFTITGQNFGGRSFVQTFIQIGPGDKGLEVRWTSDTSIFCRTKASRLLVTSIDTWTYQHTPTAAGTYQLSVTLSKSHLQGSPSTVTVDHGPASPFTTAASMNITALVVVAKAFVTQQIVISVRDQYGNRRVVGGDLVGAVITSSSAVVATTIADNLDGSYTIVYTPTASTLHSASFALNQIQLFGSSPITYVVKAGPVNAATTSARGDTLSTAVAGMMTTFSIDPRDASYTPVTDGVATFQLVSSNINNNNFNSTLGNCSYVATSQSYTCAFLKTKSGSFQLSVLLSGTYHISASPFNVLVYSAPVATVSTTIPTEVTAGSNNTFVIVAQDEYGNIVDQDIFSSSRLAFSGSVLESSGKLTQLTLSTHSDGTALGWFIVTSSSAPANITLSQFNAANGMASVMPGSPFSVIVCPDGVVLSNTLVTIGRVQNGILVDEAREVTTFTVVVRDQWLNVITGADATQLKFSLSYMQMDPPVGTKKIQGQGYITGLSGSYSITVASQWNISLTTLNGTLHVGNSPFALNVLAANASTDAVGCLMQGPGLEFVIAGPNITNQFTITPMDRFRNIRPISSQPTAGWKIVVNNVEKPIVPQASDNKYKAEFSVLFQLQPKDTTGITLFTCCRGQLQPSYSPCCDGVSATFDDGSTQTNITWDSSSQLYLISHVFTNIGKTRVTLQIVPNQIISSFDVSVFPDKTSAAATTFSVSARSIVAGDPVIVQILTRCGTGIAQDYTLSGNALDYILVSFISSTSGKKVSMEAKYVSGNLFQADFHVVPISGEYFVSVWIGGIGIVTGSTANVTVNPAAAKVSASTAEVDVASIPHGVTSIVAVQPRDPYGNPAATQTGGRRRLLTGTSPMQLSFVFEISIPQDWTPGLPPPAGYTLSSNPGYWQLKAVADYQPSTNSYAISYKLLVAGSYVLNMTMFSDTVSGIHIAGSPTAFVLPAGQPSESSSTHTALAQDFTVGVANSFTIVTRDSNENRLFTTGLLYDVQMRGPLDSLVSTVSSTVIRMDSVADNNDGTYTASFSTAFGSGAYNCTVVRNSIQLSHSPFTIRIRPGLANVANTIVSGDGLNVKIPHTAGVSTFVSVTPYDYHGNIIGPLDATTTIRATPDNHVWTLAWNSTAIAFQGSWMVTAAATYSISVMVSSIAVGKSPYSISVLPSAESLSVFGVQLGDCSTSCIAGQAAIMTIQIYGSLVAPTNVYSCGNDSNFVLDASASIGAGGRPLRFNWGLLVGSQNQNEILTQLVKYKDNATATVLTQSLVIGELYTFMVRITDFLGSSMVVVKEVTRTAIAMPQMYIIGPSPCPEPK